MPKEKLKSIFINIMTSVISLIIILIISEIAIRTFGKQGYYTSSSLPKEMYDFSHPSRHKAGFIGSFPKSEIHGSIVINSKGLRDVERDYQRNSKFRILGLGDSFAFGHGVELEESFLYITEELLNAKFENGLEIVKAGSPGVGPDTYLNYLSLEGYRFNPDLVLVNIFLGNDIDNLKLESKKQDLKGTSNQKKASFKIFLRKNVHLYSFTVDRLKTLPVARNYLRESGLLEPPIGRELFEVYRINPSADTEKRWQYCFNILDSIRAISINMVVCLIPAREQCSPERFEMALSQFSFESKDFSSSVPNQRFAEYCLERNIPMVDLTDILIEEGISNYYEIDPHFNVKGNQTAGKYLADNLYRLILNKSSQ